ncbi:MAG: cytoplasmic protein [Oleiphilus sp.]|nr:MAG: cytoplasmic protein [Oleiphilus sp.]
MLEPGHLLDIANTEMPFGKYRGRILIDLPEEYLLWFQKQGFPGGKLGELLAWTLELKIEGLEKLVKPLKGKRLDPAQSQS